MRNQGTQRTCVEGHLYYQRSDCNTCPVCEEDRKLKEGFLSLIPAPARRALESKNILNLEQLSQYTETDVLEFHGLGPGSIPKLRKALKEKGLNFKK